MHNTTQPNKAADTDLTTREGPFTGWALRSFGREQAHLMPGLTLDELSAMSGCAAETVQAYAAHGLIVTAQSVFERGDIFRVRLIKALLDAGVRLDDLAALVRGEQISLQFAGSLMADPVGLADETAQATLVRLGLEKAFVERLRMAAGQQGVADADRYRHDDVEILEFVASARGMGISDDVLVGIYRLLSHSLRRTVDGMRDLFRDEVEQQLLKRGLSHAQMIEQGAAMRLRLQTAGLRISQLLQRRFLEEAVFDNVIIRIQQVLQQAGLSQLDESNTWIVAFCDLAGFTRMVNDAGDSTAGEMARLLEQYAQEEAARHGGRLIKALGDGVLLVFQSAGNAARACSALIARSSEGDLPPLRIGLASGQLIMRDGDVFGRTVNLAARIVATARPGMMVADDATWHLLEAGGEYSVAVSREAELKGFAARVILHEIAMTAAE